MKRPDSFSFLIRRRQSCAFESAIVCSLGVFPRRFDCVKFYSVSNLTISSLSVLFVSRTTGTKASSIFFRKNQQEISEIKQTSRRGSLSSFFGNLIYLLATQGKRKRWQVEEHALEATNIHTPISKKENSIGNTYLACKRLQFLWFVNVKWKKSGRKSTVKRSLSDTDI